MMCLLFVFFAAKIHHIYIHWEIVTKYLFPQKCCPSEDKLFIRNAVLSSQMAVFEDKFNLAAPHPDWESNPRGNEEIRLPSNHSRDIHSAPSRTRECHCRVLCVRCSRVKYRVKYFRGEQAVSRQFVTEMDNLSVLLCQKVHNSTFPIGLVFWYAICLIFCRIR